MGLEILIPILAIMLGGLIFLVPILGLTLRFALKPVVEAYERIRSAHGEGGAYATVLEQRLALVEQQMHHLESSLRDIEEQRDFDRRLAAGSAPVEPGAAPMGVFPRED
jgi:hypothetical protein